jgi:hypothetical protein
MGLGSLKKDKELKNRNINTGKKIL